MLTFSQLSRSIEIIPHPDQMRSNALSGNQDWPSLDILIANRSESHSRRQSQVSDLSSFSGSSAMRSRYDGNSSANVSPNPQSSNTILSYSCSQASPGPSKVEVYRHHRHSSNASEASSKAPFSESFSNSLALAQVNSSPAPSCDEIPNGGSPYVEEPLPMEGDFASMDLRSSPGNLNSFLSADQQASQDASQALRYNTLTWAREHHYPEPRQETMLATGGLHPKASISSLTAMLESQLQQQNSPQPQLCDYNNQADLGNCALHSSEPAISPSDPTSKISHTMHCSPFSTSLRPDIPATEQQQFSCPDVRQAPAIMLSPNNPTSPSLRLDMNHPDMIQGPSISLTSATPLTAKPGPCTGSGDFQKVLEDMVNSKEPSVSALTSNRPVGDQRTEDGLFNSTLFGSNNTNFLNPRPVRGRQRSKSESIAKQNPTVSGESLPFYQGNLLAYSNSSNISSFNFGTAESDSNLPATFWNALHQVNQESVAQSPTQPSMQYDFLNTLQTDRIWSSINGMPSDSQSQSFMSAFNPKRRGGGPGYDSSFLQPLPSTSRRSHSVSHVHRRGQSESGIFGEALVSPNFGSTTDRLLEAHGLSPAPQCVSSGDNHFGIALSAGESSSLNMPDPSWISSFPALGSGYPNADLRNGSPVGSERLLPSQQVSPRARSHSHSSFGSEDTTASGLPAEYKSRTTAATKAAAAKRRKEGVAARYVCDMCGETFTRRYNLRGHQRAHKGEKPFECGFPGCTSRFARAHDQKRHYKLHLGVKDYNCKACGKAFIRLDALQRHHKSDAGHACFQKLQSSSTAEQFYDVSQQNFEGILTEGHQLFDGRQSISLSSEASGNLSDSYHHQPTQDAALLQYSL